MTPAAITMILIGILAFAGLLVSLFLRRQKVKQKPVKCLFKEKCNKVLDSKYATFFNMPTELMGMLYYLLILVGMGALWWIVVEINTTESFGNLLNMENLTLSFSAAIIITIIVLTATLALIFSLRQIFVQAAVLRAWCSWCLFTAVLNAAIFGLFVYLFGEGIVSLAQTFRFITLPIHLTVAIVALGMATFSDFVFFHFLKDFWISERESKLLDKISEAIWFLVVLFLVSGAAVYLSDIARYNASPKFQVKMVVVAVIILNGMALNLYLSPKLRHIPFNKEDDHLRSHRAAEIRRARNIMFLLGPVSLVSWYSAMALGFLKDVPFNFWQLLGLYAVLLAAGTLSGQIMGKMLYRADRHKKNKS